MATPFINPATNSPIAFSFPPSANSWAEATFQEGFKTRPGMPSIGWTEEGWEGLRVCQHIQGRAKRAACKLDLQRDHRSIHVHKPR